MVVAESHQQHIFQAATDYVRSLFTTLALTFGVLLACLLAKYHIQHWMGFSETFRKYSVDLQFKLINVWSQCDSRWPPELISVCKHKNEYNKVNFVHSGL